MWKKAPPKLARILNLSMVWSPMKIQNKSENVNAYKSSQGVVGKNRELHFLFMAPKTRAGCIVRTSNKASFVAIRVKSKASVINPFPKSVK